MSIPRAFEDFATVAAAARDAVPAQLEPVAAHLKEVLAEGGKILACGNGGSAADAQHFAAELVGRYEKERAGRPAIALNVDTSALTAIANDYGFERVFARQVEALGQNGDALIAISTSGSSPNVIAAVREAKGRGLYTVALTGESGGKLAGEAHALVKAPSDRTARIQEVHAVCLHALAEALESSE